MNHEAGCCEWRVTASWAQEGHAPPTAVAGSGLRQPESEVSGKSGKTLVRDFAGTGDIATLEQLQAERMLAHMRLLEGLARLAESEVHDRLRNRLRDGYKRVIGCFPESRDDVRAALERIKGGERGTIEAVFAAYLAGRS